MARNQGNNSNHPLRKKSPIGRAGGLTAAKANAALDEKQDDVPTMTAAQAEAGTSEVPMLVTPKVLNDEIARQIAAIP